MSGVRTATAESDANNRTSQTPAKIAWARLFEVMQQGAIKSGDANLMRSASTQTNRERESSGSQGIGIKCKRGFFTKLKSGKTNPGVKGRLDSSQARVKELSNLKNCKSRDKPEGQSLISSYFPAKESTLAGK